MEDRFVDNWPEDSPIAWQNDGRRRLNQIIDSYNLWLLHGRPVEAMPALLRAIEFGRQTIGRRDGGSEWLRELDGMLDFVEANYSSAEERT